MVDILSERKSVGILLTINFIVFWAVPIFVQGQIWKYFLSYFMHPLFSAVDNSKVVQKFAAKYIYAKPISSKFFLTSLFSFICAVACVSYVFYYQLQYGYLPLWLVFAYNFAWVGAGGRQMGAAYALAHKEGHNRMLYKGWIRNSVGNIFENWVGLFFGNVPYNFTTSHIAIHHRLNGGKGDTFYQWDLDRTSWSDFMLFLHRILLHTSGYSSLLFFKANGMTAKEKLLKHGCYVYWLVVPILIFAITRSPLFFFYIYLQPFFCMTYFLAFLNFAFHGFIENDDKGNSIWCVNSVTIIEGDDDYFGEDDHMLHHYASTVFYTELDEYRKTKMADLKKYHASVFRKMSIVEMAFYLLFKDFKTLAKHYVDFTKKLKQEEIEHMLEVRAKRKEMSHEDYKIWRASHLAVMKE